MKIAQLLTELGAGGAEKVALELSRGLMAKGHSVLAISLKPPPENQAILNDFRESEIPTIFLNMEKSRPYGLLKLPAILRSEAPDLIHSHLMHSNIASRLLKPLHRIPLVNTVHIAERRPGMKPWFALDNFSFGLCDACTAVSRAAAEYHERALGLRQGSIRVVYNGMDGVKPAEKEKLDSIRKQWSLEGCEKIIGSIGRLDWQKGYDLLLGTLPQVSKGIPEGRKWALLIIGEGPERAKLEALASQAPSNIAVRMPGFREDAPSLMRLFDVFAMPSRYEGYGLALAEAMSLGLPVVTSKADSLPELCEGYPAAACVDFDPEKPEPAAAAIIRGAQSSMAAPKILMSVDGMTDSYLAVYREVLKRRGKS